MLSYSVGDEIFLSRKLFTAASGATQPFNRLVGQRYGLSSVLELIRKNAVRLNLPDTIWTHLKLHIEHSSGRRRPSDDISTIEAEPAQPLIDD